MDHARLPTVAELAGTVRGLLLVLIQNQVKITGNQREILQTLHGLEKSEVVSYPPAEVARVEP